MKSCREDVRELGFIGINYYYYMHNKNLNCMYGKVEILVYDFPG